MLYVGTSAPDETGAIWAVPFCEKTGALGTPAIVPNTHPAVFMHADVRLRQLYAATNSGDTALVTVYKSSNTGLEVKRRISMTGRGLAYLDVDADREILYGAYYTDGMVESLSLKESVQATSITQCRYTGHSVNALRQEAPHPHSIVLSPDKQWAVVCDLGTDRLYCYHVAADGRLVVTSQGAVDVRPGCGPRYAVFHPNGRWLYVVTELGNTLLQYALNPANGQLRLLCELPLLPGNVSGEINAGDLHGTADGTRLYVMMRGMDSIASVRLDKADGTPHIAGYDSCGGEWCISFTLAKNEKYVILANYRSGNLVVKELNGIGRVGKTVSEQTLAWPISIRQL